MARLLERALLERAPIIPFHEPAEARRLWREHRVANNFGPRGPLLTPPDGNYKLNKSEVPTYGLSLAPASVSGFNVCPDSTVECRKHCVATAGKGPFVEGARVSKVKFLAKAPHAFVSLLTDEIHRAVKKHGEVAVRLNVFSDLPWHRIAPHLFKIEGVQFYDYTKAWNRVDEVPDNWHLTYSVTEDTGFGSIIEAIDAGRNVAVVFAISRFKPLPTMWLGLNVVDGDDSDARWLDGGTETGVVVGLRAKGSMRRGSSMALQVT